MTRVTPVPDSRSGDSSRYRLEVASAISRPPRGLAAL